MNECSPTPPQRENQTLRQMLEKRVAETQKYLDDTRSALASNNPILDMTNSEAEKFGLWF